jgi:hypothetical protein
MKASDSYPSLVQGVSQQAPETRGPGRMTEQVNMIPDPVYGLTRRHGTVFVADKDTAIPAVSMENVTDDTATYRTLPVNNGTDDIDIVYRAGPKGVSDIAPVIAFNRTTNEFMDYTRNPVDDALDAWENEGASSMVSIGKYVFSAGLQSAVTGLSTDAWASSPNDSRAAVWVRGGSYSRTFKVAATNDIGTTYTVSYTTPSAAYPGVLDTAAVQAFVLDPAGGTTSDNETLYTTKTTGTPPWGTDTYYWSAKLGYGKFSPTITASTLYSSGTPTAMANSYPAKPTGAHYYHAPNSEFVYLPADAFDPSEGDINVVWADVTYTHNNILANPNYSRLVNDITADYNTAVTQWIGTAAAAIQAEAIAAELNALLIAAGLTGGTVVGSHILWENVTALTVSDSGDGSLIRAVAQTVRSISDLTDVHYPGKVVRVQAQANAESFYLEARADGTTPAEVSWVESGRYDKSITGGLIYLMPVGDKLYAASSASLLNTLIPDDHPDWIANRIGDDISNPMPSFVGRAISYLGVFQDRLLVGSKGTLTMSRTGDYLNFFRSTVVTVPASDAFSMRAEGPEDDTLRFSAIYNRDLIAFGQRRQYLVPGRTALAATAASMPIVSNHADAADIPPVDVGGYIFYASSASDRSSVSQIEPTVNIDSPASFPASSQLDDYIQGAMIEMMSGSKPLSLYCRASGNRHAIYVFQYVDGAQGRRQDAWYRWQFNDALGPIVGMSYKGSRMMVYFIREDAGTLWLVADEVDLTSGLSSRPYFDSMRRYSEVAQVGHTLSTVPTSPWSVAYDNSTPYFLQGRVNATEAAALSTSFPLATPAARWVGCAFDAYTIPTNPYMKDKNDVAITSGVLTVSTLATVVTDSSGLTYTVQDKNSTETYTLNGRVLGDTLIGRVPITTGTYDLNVYADNTEYTLTLSANSWLPLTISSIDWVGQFFNRTARR